MKKGDLLKKIQNPWHVALEALAGLGKDQSDWQGILETLDEYDRSLSKPQFLELTAEEKNKIDKILDVFQDYIDMHPQFDIFYSKKFGYIHWDIDGYLTQFETADEIMECLIREIYMDVRNLELEGEHVDIYMTSLEEIVLRNRVVPFMEKLGPNTHYLALLNNYIEELRGNT